MLKAQIAQTVQLLDLMLEYFADDGHWTRGRYDDGNDGHCLIGALLGRGRGGAYHRFLERIVARVAVTALLQRRYTVRDNVRECADKA